MRVAPRGRVGLEASIAAVATGLGVLSAFWPDWIEAIFGANPDDHSGSAEWTVVTALFVVALGLAVVAGWEWRRAVRCPEVRPGRPR